MYIEQHNIYILSQINKKTINENFISQINWKANTRTSIIC